MEEERERVLSLLTEFFEGMLFIGDLIFFFVWGKGGMMVGRI